MYTFEDRNGDSLTLRPEGRRAVYAPASSMVFCTIRNSVVVYRAYVPSRASAERALSSVHQLGCEVFGLQGPDIDAELICSLPAGGARWVFPST